MFFSVIVPTYNRAQVLREALDSVLAQTFADYEIIAVDDGSSDGTAAVAAAYQSRVRFLRQPNEGPGAARNTGLKCAAGTFVAFLDSDDLWFPWTLEVYHKVLRATDSGWVAGEGLRVTSRDGFVVPPFAPVQWTCHQDYLSTAERPLWVGTCATAIRRDLLLRTGGFAPGHMNAEDSDLWLKLGTFPFGRIQSPYVFAYRKAATGAASDPIRSYRGMLHLLLQERSGAYPGGAARRRERLAILTRHTRPVALALARRGFTIEALDLHLKTLVWNARLGKIRYLVGFWPVLMKSHWARPIPGQRCV